MAGNSRKSGINIIGDIPWGTHFCQFYETPEDLISILVPYFKAGLENNEFCMWVTAEPLDEESAREALGKAMPDFDRYLEKGQIEIIPHDRWYLRDGKFDLQVVLGSWLDKLDHALKQGYEGLRVTGNTAWLEKKDWKSFTKYEEEINRVIGNYRMLSICTYSLNRCDGADVIDVVNNHQFALIRRQGKWQLMESTKHKQTEESLRRVEENFRRSMDGSPLGIRIVSADGEVLYANRAILDIYGYDSLEELNKIPTKKRYTPESYTVHQVRKEKRQRGEYVPSNYVISIVRKDGEVRHLEVFRKEVLWNGKTQFQVLYNDITEHKKMEEALQEKQNFINSHVKAMRDGFSILDNQGIHIDVNSALCEMTGFSREELIGVGLPHPYWPPERYEDINRAFQKTVAGDFVDIESTFMRKNGERFPVVVSPSWTKDKQGNVVSYFATVKDITERKKAEGELRDSEQYFRALFEQAGDSIYILDIEGKHIVNCNNQACIALGYSREEILQLPPSDIEDILAHEEIADTHRRLETEESPTIQSRHRRKDGTTFPVEIRFGRIDLAQHKFVIAAVRDITERERSEKSLRKSEEELRLMFESVTDGITITDINGNIVDANESTVRIHGYDSKQQLIGRSAFELIAQRDHAKATNNLKKTLEEGHSRILEYTFLRYDGSEFLGELSAALMRDQSGEPSGFVAITRDTTERKQAEEREKQLNLELNTASRLATVGEMAAGIAHEINNPLTGVVGFSDLLLKKKLPEDIRKDVDIIYEGARRIASIVDKMLRFARQTTSTLTHVNINKIIETTLAMRASEMGVNNIRVTTELDPDLPLTSADASLLQQTFLNIILNAEQAIKEAHGKGNLTVKTEKIDNTMRISFKDDGPGIARENLEKLFNPFFTTKGPDKGTGLGLSICYSIIKQHGGKIYAESTSGKGATFFIELPIVDKGEQLKLSEPAAGKPKSTSKARILVIDDDPTVPEFITAVLTGEGHEVKIVNNGDDAIERLGNEEYDVILLDIKLPGKSGIEIYRELEKKDKATINKIIFITGDVMSTSTMDFIQSTRIPYITKPFDAAHLVMEIGRIISQQS